MSRLLDRQEQRGVNERRWEHGEWRRDRLYAQSRLDAMLRYAYTRLSRRRW